MAHATMQGSGKVPRAERVPLCGSRGGPGPGLGEVWLPLWFSWEETPRVQQGVCGGPPASLPSLVALEIWAFVAVQGFLLCPVAPPLLFLPKLGPPPSFKDP